MCSPSSADMADDQPLALFSIAELMASGHDHLAAIDAELPSKLAAPNHVAMPRDENLARSMGVSANFMRSVQQVCAEQRFTSPASLDVHHARRARVVSSRKTKLTSSFLSADHVGSEGALPSLCSRV